MEQKHEEPGAPGRRRAVAAAVVATAVGAAVVLTLSWLRAPYATRVVAGAQAPDVQLRGLVAGEGRILAARAPATVLLLIDTRWPGMEGYARSVERLYRRYLQHGLHAGAVFLDADAAAARAFVDRNALTFPVYHDPGGRAIAPLYGTPPGAETYVIDGSGRVASVTRGVVDWSRPDRRRAIEALLPSPPPGLQ